MKIWGISMVKNEVDIIGFTISHMLSQGVDRILVADNMSTDGTFELLNQIEIETKHRVRVLIDPEPGYYQSEKMTDLGHEAWLSGLNLLYPSTQMNSGIQWFQE